VTDPTSKYSIAARIYNELTVTFLCTLLDGHPHTGQILPAGTSVNVNYPSTDNCPTAASISWIFTRLRPATSGTIDVKTCRKDQLPDEATVIRSGCYATISVFNAATIKDVNAKTQEFVLKKVEKLLTCPNE
jgi:hypothetical protein